MTALVKFLITLILSVFLVSCNFNYGVKGNGNVQTEIREINNNFSGIKASNGLEVFITQSTDVKVKVQADDNLLELIKTEIKDGILHIYTSENIGKAEAKKVLVNFTDLSLIKTSSGSYLTVTNTLNTNELSLKSSSGSSIKLNTKTNKLTCDSSSGSNITLEGNTNYINAEASSGSLIKARNLLAQNCQTDASSGANIKVNCSESINAESSSGSNIKYGGNPKTISKNKSSGGSISAL